MKKLVNLTPHDVNIVVEGMEPVNVPASGTVARVTTTTEQVGSLDGIPVVKTRFSEEVTDLPEPQEGIIFLVSALVAQAVPERDYVLVPANLIRDEQGKIVGAAALQRIS